MPLTTKTLPYALVTALADPGVMAAFSSIMYDALSSKIDNLLELINDKDARIEQLESELSDSKKELCSLKKL